MGDFDAGGKSVEEDAAGFLFENGYEFAIGGEVVVIAENGSGEVAVESSRGAQIVMRGIAIDEQCVGAKDFVGEVGLADELIEADREEFGAGVVWKSAILRLRRSAQTGRPVGPFANARSVAR